MKVVSLAELQAAVNLEEMRDVVRASFIAAAHGRGVLPGVLHLDLGEPRGDLHVKGGWLTEQPTFAIKVTGAFAGAAAVGLPPRQGLSSAFDADTGTPIALLLDDGWLTEMRTGAAGAAAIEHLAPSQVHTLALIGAGSQARHQAHAALRVRSPDRVLVWARRPDAAARLVDELQRTHGLAAHAVASAAAAVTAADVVITATPARAPLLHAADLPNDVLIIAVGADTPGKQELDPTILAHPSRMIVDDRSQCATQGELQHAIAADLLTADDPLVLGELLAAPASVIPGWTVVDLTGLGVQDAAAAQLSLNALGLSPSR